MVDVRAFLIDLIQPQGKLVDLGCAFGYLVQEARTRGYQAFGLDISSYALSREPGIAGLMEGDLQVLPLRGSSADVVVLFDVLEHLTDPWAVIDRLSAMLAPGGCIIASIPNVRNYRLVVPLVFQGKFDLADSGILDRTHLRWFVKDTAKSLMSRGGLRVECCRGFFEGPKKKTFNLLTLGVFRNFLTIQYYIRAVKLA